MVELKVLSPRPQVCPAVDYFHSWKYPDGTKWAEFYRTGTVFLLRFPDLADFEVAADGCSVTCLGPPGISEPTINHLYLNQVLPLALSLQGKLVFHASAVDLAGQAIMFMGESGRGKSTLAAYFALNGYSFLTDDGLLLEEANGSYTAFPSHPSVRLWDNSRHMLFADHADFAPPLDYTSKSRLLAGGNLKHCAEPKPLVKAFLIGEGNSNGVAIRQLSGAESLITWTRHSFILDVDNKARLARNFERISELATTVPCYTIEYPRNFCDLPKVMDAILQHSFDTEIW